MKYNSRTFTLGEVCFDYSYGYTASAKDERIGPKFLRITDIRDYFIDWENVPYCDITQEKYEKNKLSFGDIVVARTGANTGLNTVIDGKGEGAVFASYLIRYKINKEIANPFYIGYLMKTNEWKGYVNGIIGGSAQPGANAKQFAKFSFQLPPLQVQNKVVKILKKFDLKEQLNLEIIASLEELVQTLFKRWFIDFNFPKEDGEPYHVSGGKMVESEFGLIPLGWEVGRLKNLYNIRSGFAFKSKWWQKQGVPVVKIKDIDNQTINFESCSYVEEDKINLAKEFRAEEGDLLIALTGATVGKLGLVPKTDGPLLVNQRVGKFFLGEQSLDRIGFLYGFLSNKTTMEKIIDLAYGSAQPNLSPSSLENIKLPIPQEPLIKEFNNKTRSIFESITKKHYANQKLSALRDILLPKLLSGEINLSEKSELLEDDLV